MTMIANFKVIVDEMKKKSGADGLRILVDSIDLTAEFWFARKKDRRTGDEIAAAWAMAIALDMYQEIDRNNPYFGNIAMMVKRAHIAHCGVLNASTEPEPGADHQPPQPAL